MYTKTTFSTSYSDDLVDMHVRLQRTHPKQRTAALSQINKVNCAASSTPLVRLGVLGRMNQFSGTTITVYRNCLLCRLPVDWSTASPLSWTPGHSQWRKTFWNVAGVMQPPGLACTRQRAARTGGEVSQRLGRLPSPQPRGLRARKEL